MKLYFEVLGQERQQSGHAVLEAAQSDGLAHEDDVQQQTATLSWHLCETARSLLNRNTIGLCASVRACVCACVSVRKMVPK